MNVSFAAADRARCDLRETRSPGRAGFTLEVVAQAEIEIGKQSRTGVLRVDVAQVQPLSGEVARQRFRTRIAKHPPDLLFEHRRSLEPALHGEIEQLVVGDAAPQEKRQTGRQLEIADAIDTTCGGLRGIALDAEQELRAHQDAFEPLFDAGVESAVARSAS